MNPSPINKPHSLSLSQPIPNPDLLGAAVTPNSVEVVLISDFTSNFQVTR